MSKLALYRSDRTQTARRAILLAATVLFGLSFSLVAAEFLLRATGHKPWRNAPLALGMPLMQEPHRELGWRNKPGTYTFGKGARITMSFWPDGLRATAPERRHRNRQVLVLGGSCTQGWALSDPDTFAWKLQETFPQVEVLNFGTAAYGTYQSLLTLERYLEASATPPELVVYGFGDYHERRNVAEPGWLHGLSRMANSGTVRVPYVTLGSDEALERHSPKGYPDWPLKRWLATVTFLEQRYAMFTGRSRRLHARRATKALLLEMHRLSRRHDTRLLVAMLAAWDPRARAEYKRFMRKQRIPIVDCTHPEFAAPKMKVPVYGHPNWRMNAHWAECIGGAVGELLSP